MPGVATLNTDPNQHPKVLSKITVSLRTLFAIPSRHGTFDYSLMRFSDLVI